MVYAGFWRRLVAHFIDKAILFAFTFAITFPIGLVVGGAAAGVAAVEKEKHRHEQHSSAIIHELIPLANEYTTTQDLINATPSNPSINQTPQTVTSVEKENSEDMSTAVAGVLVIVGGALFGLIINIAYHTGFVASSWQATPGKRVMGCVVVKDDGSRLTIGRALGRHLACAVSSMTLWIGYMMVGWTKQSTALHDLICDTRVVRTVRTPPVLATA